MKPVRFPVSVPKTMPTHLGPIPVKLVDDLKVDNDVVFGAFNPRARVIELRSGMHLKTMQATLWHEWIHCVLFDAGIKLKKSQEESVCDAVATALTALFTN